MRLATVKAAIPLLLSTSSLGSTSFSAFRLPTQESHRFFCTATPTLHRPSSSKKHKRRNNNEVVDDGDSGRDLLLPNQFPPNEDALLCSQQQFRSVKEEEGIIPANGGVIALHRSAPFRDSSSPVITTTSATVVSGSSRASSSLDFVTEAKDSVFQAYVAVDAGLTSTDAIGTLIDALKVDDPRLASEATHPFMYGGLLMGGLSSSTSLHNSSSLQGGVGATGGGGSSSAVRYVHDDDGEKGAGNAIVSVIRTKYEALLVSNNLGCCVIISRWFGGTMLGPARFKIIAALTDKALGAYTKNLTMNSPSSSSKHR